MQTFLASRVTLHSGDCLDVLRALPDASIDSIVTDPPYALVSIVKRFGGKNAAPAKGDVYARASSGFMGKQWDTGERAFSVEFWTECLRVLKPGGHVAAFSGTRTYHRLACAIEDAGFEIRDQLAWTYGTGFPKSHSMRGIGRSELGTALKPAWEPIVLARKPLIGTVAENVLRHGTGAVNVDGCRIPTHGEDRAARYAGNAPGGGETVFVAYRQNEAWEAPDGRWPANLIHDGSDEVVSLFPESGVHGGPQTCGYSSSAARFFYSAKADADDRLGSKHPTVKPVDLMQWLVRLITPPGGVVLDPFAGTGTTGEAAFREGMSAVLVEREPEYQADIARRMALVLAGPEEKKRALATPQPAESLPLFGGVA